MTNGINSNNFNEVKWNQLETKTDFKSSKGQRPTCWQHCSPENHKHTTGSSWQRAHLWPHYLCVCTSAHAHKHLSVCYQHQPAAVHPIRYSVQYRKLLSHRLHFSLISLFLTDTLLLTTCVIILVLQDVSQLKWNMLIENVSLKSELLAF